MTDIVRKILAVAPIIQSAALVEANLKFLKKKKKKARDFAYMGVGTIVGASLIKSESDFIKGI
jgi:hypothetical protein